MDDADHYTTAELEARGLPKLGQNVQIDRTVRILGAERLEIGSNVRIDAFCLISAGEGGIRIGDYVHISAGSTLAGAGRIVIDDFCGLSNRVSVFSANDDYSGGWMTNPLVPDEFKNVTVAPVTLCKHAIVGSGSVILPGVELGVGASVGALSVVNKSIPEFAIVSGNPVRRIGTRDRRLLELEARFRGRGDR